MKVIFQKLIPFFLCLLTGTAGCTVGITVGIISAPISIAEGGYVPKNVPLVFEEENINKSIQLFYNEWIDVFNDGKDDNELKSALEKLYVEFTEKEIPVAGGYSMKGEPFPEGELVDCWGVVKAPNFIQVWIREKPYQIGKTSLVHELVHIALNVKNKGYDSDHLGNKFDGWTKKHSTFIDVLNAKLLLQSL